MKELEKTKRISIATTLFILAILIGFLTYDRPKNTYAYNTKSTLEELTSNDHFVTMSDLDNPDMSLIDIRSPFEYSKGYLENAINIPTPNIFDEENQTTLNNLKNSGKTLVVYGKTPEEANMAFLMLYQLGFDTIKLLPVKLEYLQNKLITTPVDIEKQENDIKAFIAESVEKANIKEEIKVTPPAVEKKPVVLKPKKKKRAPEGGC